MHDVLTVTSQGSDGGHTRKTTPASRSSTSTTDEESTRLMKKALIGGIAGLTATPVANAAPGGGWS